MKNTAHNNSVVKAFKILEYFSNAKSQWGVRELARRLDAHESTTYRLMSTLESIGVLYKNPETDKYALGLKLHELGHRVKIYDSLVQLSHPELEKLADNIEETVHMAIWHKDNILMIDKVESEKGLRLDSVIGQNSPAHCTGLGKILLAFSNELKLNAFLNGYNFKAFTKHTIKDSKTLRQKLLEIKEQGYAIDRQEFELGLICVAVPVYNNNGQVVAALSAAGPSDRFKESHLQNYLKILKKGAQNISEKIGNFKKV